MIEITPKLTTHPIKKIKKINRDQQKTPDKKQSQEHENENKDVALNDSEPQHIDEIV